MQAASAGTARALDKAGALAMLVSLKGKYLVKRSAVTLGRTTSTHGKVSRQQVWGGKYNYLGERSCCSWCTALLISVYC